MSNDIPNDFFGLTDMFKKISEAFNESLEQTKRQSQCKMRRFYVVRNGDIKVLGVVFPGGNVVAQYTVDKSVTVFNNIEDLGDRFLGETQWIDPEPAQ